jgi:hypothetical protein
MRSLARMADQVVLREIVLEPRHRDTGNTRHVVGGSPMPRPAVLRISRYVDDPGFYLLYLDAAGDDMTDTWYQTLDDAMEQATFEFDVRPHEWQLVAETP